MCVYKLMYVSIMVTAKRRLAKVPLEVDGYAGYLAKHFFYHLLRETGEFKFSCLHPWSSFVMRRFCFPEFHVASLSHHRMSLLIVSISCCVRTRSVCSVIAFIPCSILSAVVAGSECWILFSKSCIHYLVQLVFWSSIAVLERMDS